MGLGTLFFPPFSPDVHWERPSVLVNFLLLWRDTMARQLVNDSVYWDSQFQRVRVQDHYGREQQAGRNGGMVLEQ